MGSFNPFTIGHDSIVRRALPLFDRLVIGVVGDNVHKPDMPKAEERMQAIKELYADDPRIEVKPYHGLAMDFAKAENAQFIVKGVRTASDFEYEQWQADFNRRLGGIETILLYTEPELASVSSSAVLVDVQGCECHAGNLGVDGTVAFHLGEVAHAAQQRVGNTWCATRAAGNLHGGVFGDGHAEQPCRALNDAA